MPDHFIKREIRGHYRGQKQIWFLLRMVGRDCDVNLRLTEHPEFDAWRWHDYWVPLDVVIEFKRDVYQRALQELSRFLVRPGACRRSASRALFAPAACATAAARNSTSNWHRIEKQVSTHYACIPNKQHEHIPERRAIAS